MVYEYLTRLWGEKVKSGLYTIEDVPSFLRKKVSAYIEGIDVNE